MRLNWLVWLSRGEAVSNPDCECAPEAVRTELERIIDSADFDATERNRRFLRYIVEETLAGRRERIKAYNIALSVFGRGDSFDPQMDAIVRIEARRLRRSLERYYLTAGKTDPIRIDIPKGAYAPVFCDGPGEPAHDAAVPLGARAPGATGLDRRNRPSILVAPFEQEGDLSAFPGLARGFVRKLIIALTRFENLYVFGVETSHAHDSRVDVPKLCADLDADYVLTGGIVLSAGHFEVETLLIHARTGRAIWAENIDRVLNPAEIFNVRNEVANSIAGTLAQTYGVIHISVASDSDGNAPASIASLACVLRFHDYMRDYNRDRHEQVRDCLERAIINDPDYAEAHACLSQVYSNAYRFGFGPNLAPLDPRERALELASRAVDLAPRSSSCHHALALAYWFKRDVAASLRAYETGLALNPNDTVIMADLGLRCALLGDWKRAVQLLEESYARNPGQPGSFRVGLAFYHYVHGRYAASLSEARRARAPHVAYGMVLEAMALAQLGRNDEARLAVDRLLAIDPKFGAHVWADLKRRNVRPDFIQMVIEGLSMAGLRCTDSECTERPMIGVSQVAIPGRP